MICSSSLSCLTPPSALYLLNDDFVKYQGGGIISVANTSTRYYVLTSNNKLLSYDLSLTPASETEVMSSTTASTIVVTGDQLYGIDNQNLVILSGNTWAKVPGGSSLDYQGGLTYTPDNKILYKTSTGHNLITISSGTATVSNYDSNPNLNIALGDDINSILTWSGGVGSWVSDLGTMSIPSIIAGVYKDDIVYVIDNNHNIISYTNIGTGSFNGNASNIIKSDSNIWIIANNFCY